jgi:hypothetical protein
LTIAIGIVALVVMAMSPDVSFLYRLSAEKADVSELNYGNSKPEAGLPQLGCDIN